MANKKKNKSQSQGSQGTHLDGRVDAAVAEAGTVSDVEAAEAVEAARDASDELDAGDAGDGPQTEEVASQDVTEARKADTADRSPASVQPTADNDNMLNDGDHGLTPGMRANLDEEDPRKDDPAETVDANLAMNAGAEGELPNASALELASVLTVDDEATKDLSVEKAAKAVNIPRGRVLDF